MKVVLKKDTQYSVEETVVVAGTVVEVRKRDRDGSSYSYITTDGRNLQFNVEEVDVIPSADEMKYVWDDCQCTYGGEPQDPVSEVPTPYAVICLGCGLVYLSHHEYCCQMRNIDGGWTCPGCGENVSWSDEVNKEAMEELYLVELGKRYVEDKMWEYVKWRVNSNMSGKDAAENLAGCFDNDRCGCALGPPWEDAGPSCKVGKKAIMHLFEALTDKSTSHLFTDKKSSPPRLKLKILPESTDDEVEAMTRLIELIVSKGYEKRFLGRIWKYLEPRPDGIDFESLFEKMVEEGHFDKYIEICCPLCYVSIYIVDAPEDIFSGLVINCEFCDNDGEPVYEFNYPPGEDEIDTDDCNFDEDEPVFTLEDADTINVYSFTEDFTFSTAC